MGVIAEYIRILILVLNLAIFGRVIMSWISPRGNDPVSPILYQITEPLLAPIRRLMPRTGTFDFTPMVALLLINVVILPIVQRLA